MSTSLEEGTSEFKADRANLKQLIHAAGDRLSITTKLLLFTRHNEYDPCRACSAFVRMRRQMFYRERGELTNKYIFLTGNVTHLKITEYQF